MTELERRLAELWMEVLERPEVAPGDDFFELGGDSIHVLQLSLRLREQLGVEVPQRLLFQHPTLAGLAAALAKRDEAVDVVEANPQAAEPRTGSPSRSGAGPVRLPRGEPLPLSAPQRQLWYLDQLQRPADGEESGDASYNMLVVVRFHDRPVDLAAVERALDAIVERHEVLRTRFVVVDGEPRQQIDAGRRVSFLRIDAAATDPRSWGRTARELTERFLRRPFDLSRDVMLRAAALLGPEETRVVLTMHHIASDGWSIGVLLRELSALYRAFHDDPSAAALLPPLALQYADVARWQDEALDGPRRQQLLDYWQKQLLGAPQNLELPTDRPRTAGRAARNPGARHAFALGSDQLAGLRAFGRSGDTTLFMTLLAVWSAVLYRFSWQKDQLHSVPFAGRLHAASEGLVGFFTNMLVIRIGLSEGLSEESGAVRTFGELLASTRETCLDAFAHQDLPFVQLVEALRPERHGGRMPFVQIGFALQNAFRADRAYPELEIVPNQAHTGAARFDLSLSMTEEESRLAASFEYRTDLFDRATLARLALGLSALVDAVIREPATGLDRLSFLSAGERHQLLHELAGDDRPFDLGRSLHQRAEEQISLRPDAECARFEGQSLTYGELGRLAARLARRLRGHCVERVESVGLFLDRSLELPVAFLAVLQAGGVCVPLDPDHPADRLRFLLSDTAASVVVTQPHLRRRLPAGWQGIVLDVGDALAGPDAPAKPSSPEPEPESLAYVVYTSGSTGNPKGVLMHHRGLANRLLWQQEAHPLAPGDRVLQNLSIGFDAAIWQLFGPLIAGATIVLPRPGGHMDTAYLARFLVEEQVTCADFVPSLLAPLLEAAIDLTWVRGRLARNGGPEARVPRGEGWAPGLRQIVSGGEALHGELAARVFQALPTARLINVYGPTETSLTISAGGCERDGLSPTLPIGRPIANTRAYLLDPQGQPVPAGVVGEVYAGGAGITLGYLNRPELTAERFVPDPFSEEPGRRLYRTGDLARLLPDGALEFLGRADSQVKIRGVRIELGEIEARLRQLEGVLDAAVLARADVPGAAVGEKRLVAYVVQGGSDPTAFTLRAALSERLPPAMVPGIYLFLPEMPVTVNGKIDRKALPAPEGAADARPLILPRDRVEAELVGIWCRALGLEEVSVGDHFFDLGGHSLLAVKLMAEVQRSLGVALDLAELYAAGTVEEMANRLRGRTRATLPGSLVALSIARERTQGAALFCVHAVDGAVHGYAHLARRLGSGVEVYGFQAPGLEEGASPPAEVLENFEALAAYHAEALVAFFPRGAFALCGWSSGGLLASAMASRLEDLGRAPERVILLDTYLSAALTPSPSPRGRGGKSDAAALLPSPSGRGAGGEGCHRANSSATDSRAEQEFFAWMLVGGDDDPSRRLADLGGPENVYLERLTERAAGLGLLPAGAEVVVLERRWQVFRRLVEASSLYRPRAHRCPTVLIQADAAPPSWRERQIEACRALTLGPFEVETVGADHHGLLRPPAVFEVADRVARLLRREAQLEEIAGPATV